MKVCLRPIRTVEVFEGLSGQSLGIFNIDSEWEGLLKLRSKTGLLIVDGASKFSDIFQSVLVGEENKTFEVVKASPSITAQMLDAKQSAEDV